MPYRLAYLPQGYTPEEEQEYVQKYYPSYPNISMDKIALELSDNVYVMQCDFGWADLGTWHSIYECMQRTENDNVVIDSEVILDECQNNIIKLPKGHIGVFNGLDGYIVAEEGDVLLICKKSDSSALIRKYVNEVGIRYGEQYT
jgi:mannose-1-phosphate guanylyltransferase